MIPKQLIKGLIPDLLPTDHSTLSKKRIRLIRGEGVILYDDTFAVELYVPRDNSSDVEFYGVHRHRNEIDDIVNTWRRLRVFKLANPVVSPEMKRAFNEAVFQFLPYQPAPTARIISDCSFIVPSQMSAA